MAKILNHFRVASKLVLRVVDLIIPCPFHHLDGGVGAVLVRSIPRSRANVGSITSMNQTSISSMLPLLNKPRAMLASWENVPLDETSTSGVSRMESKESTNMQ